MRAADVSAGTFFLGGDMCVRTANNSRDFCEALLRLDSLRSSGQYCSPQPTEGIMQRKCLFCLEFATVSKPCEIQRPFESLQQTKNTIAENVSSPHPCSQYWTCIGKGPLTEMILFRLRSPPCATLSSGVKGSWFTNSLALPDDRHLKAHWYGTTWDEVRQPGPT